MDKKSLAIGIVIGIILVGFIFLIYNPEEQNRENEKDLNGGWASKNPFYFNVWKTAKIENIKEVSFTIERQGSSAISLTSCMDYLRANYETPASWNKFDYRCVLDNVYIDTDKADINYLTLVLNGNCRCEYILTENIIN